MGCWPFLTVFKKDQQPTVFLLLTDVSSHSVTNIWGYISSCAIPTISIQTLIWFGSAISTASRVDLFIPGRPKQYSFMSNTEMTFSDPITWLNGKQLVMIHIVVCGNKSEFGEERQGFIYLPSSVPFLLMNQWHTDDSWIGNRQNEILGYCLQYTSHRKSYSKSNYVIPWMTTLLSVLVS